MRNQLARHSLSQRIVGIRVPRPDGIALARKARDREVSHFALRIPAAQYDVTATVHCRLRRPHLDLVGQLLLQAPQIFRLDRLWRNGLVQLLPELAHRGSSAFRGEPLQRRDFCAESRVGNARQSQHLGLRLVQDLCQRFAREALFLPVQPCAVHPGRSLLADVQHDVIAESREFVVGASAFELHLHVRDLRPALTHRVEELGIDQQFPFLPNPLLHSLPQLFAAQPVLRAEDLHRGVKRLQQGQAAHVADEHRAARPHSIHSALKHLHEVIDIGKVLDDGVHNYGVVLSAHLLLIDLVRRLALQT